MSRAERVLWHAAAGVIGAGGGAAAALLVDGRVPLSALLGAVASLLCFVQPWRWRLS